MICLVTGGRNFSNKNAVYTMMDMINESYPISLLVHGAANGADSLADSWANDRGITVNPVPAKWDDLSHADADIKVNKYGKKYDRKAGSRRNQQMLDDFDIDIVVAFPGGIGTRDMLTRCKSYAEYHDIEIFELTKEDIDAIT